MKPRERISETASKLFHRQGYNSTGINQIISEANVAKATFYQHFRSKENLCVEFLEKRHEFWLNQLKNFTKGKKTNKEKILSSFDFLTFMNKKEHFRGCSFLNILSEIPPDNVKILSVIQEHKTDLRDFFKPLAMDDLLADSIYLLFEGAIIESQLFKNNWPIEKAKIIINKLLK